MEQVKNMTLLEAEKYLKEYVEWCKENLGEDDDIGTLPSIEAFEAFKKATDYIMECKKYENEYRELYGEPTEEEKNIELPVFETLECENNIFIDGTQYTNSAICDAENEINTKFEITVKGNGGTRVALLGLERLKEYILENTK